MKINLPNQIILDTLKVVSPLTAIVVNSMENKNETNNSKDSSADKSETGQQVEFTSEDAKLLKELAIAERINNSEIVEIEETYDFIGSGGIGLSKETLGITGNGSKMTKRKYTFTGLNKDVTKINEILNRSESQENASDVLKEMKNDEL